MHIKFRSRIAIETVTVVLLFLTLFVERDLGFLAVCTILVVKPLLQIALIIILVFRIREIFPIHIVTRTKIISPILIGSFLIVSISFANEIIFAREIIRFYVQRDWFNYAASIATPPNCKDALLYGCLQWFTFPSDAQQSSVTVYPFENGIAIQVESRAYIGYMHLVNQTELPQGKNVGIYGLSCEYDLGDNWYLC